LAGDPGPGSVSISVTSGHLFGEHPLKSKPQALVSPFFCDLLFASRNCNFITQFEMILTRQGQLKNAIGLLNSIEIAKRYLILCARCFD